MTFEDKAARTRLLLLDVDGVLTDGKIIMAGDGSEAKRFDIKDGAASVWAERLGLRVGLISARPSRVTGRRAAELGVRLVVQSHAPKIRAYEQIVKRQRLTDEEVAFMGDDLLDLPVIMRAGLSAAPADAAAEVRARVDYVTPERGGDGAVRTVIERILRAQGLWDRFVAEWIGGRLR